MAHMNQEKKQKIALELKKVTPANWKYSLSVEGHAKIVLTINAAPIHLIRSFKKTDYFDPGKDTHLYVGQYNYMDNILDKNLVNIFSNVFKALNYGNHDRSDIQSDYFDVGHYVEIQIGKWNKPFKVLETKK